MARAETGPMQFGDDWPGVFIRGDNACWMNHLINGLLDAETDEVRGHYVAMLQLNGARNLLHCRAQELADEQITMLKPIEDCRKEPTDAE